MKKLMITMLWLFLLPCSFLHAEDSASKKQVKRDLEQHDKRHRRDLVGDAMGRGLSGSSVNEGGSKPAQSGGTPPTEQKRKSDSPRRDTSGGNPGGSAYDPHANDGSFYKPNSQAPLPNSNVQRESN